MRKITIVSADDIILYQPTILNLYDLLKHDFEINIISFTPEYLGKKREQDKNIDYITPNKYIKFIYRKFDLLLNAFLKRVDKYLIKTQFRASFYRDFQARLLEKSLKKYTGNIIIAVDPMPLYVVQKTTGSAHFLSLEMIPNDPYFKKVDTSKIISVIIQNQFRYDFLFKEKSIRTFFIQNAPLQNTSYINQSNREGLIWAGTIVKDFAILDCMNLIEKYNEYTLTLKGAFEKSTQMIIEHKYQHLLASNRVLVNNEYLKAEDFIKFISNYKIGFCFYNWDLIKSNYNYETAPSGKLFVYLAAGVPVIASNVKAFKFLETSGAGVLVDDYEPETLYNAIQKIENDFQKYSSNAYKAFKQNCFDINAIPFKAYLLNSN
jgi:glycosyltransferase involved in cell wall biosynthesis